MNDSVGIGPVETGGRALCRLADIPDREAKGFTVTAPDGARDIFVYRDGDTIAAFVNSCPHTGGPLDWVPDRFIAPDGEHFLCATHGALFRTSDGVCIAGPCQGNRLTVVPVRVDGGFIHLG